MDPWDAVSTVAQPAPPQNMDWDAVSSVAPPPSPSFFDRVGQDISRRQEEVGQSQADMRAGNESMPAYVLDAVGKGGFGLVNDFLGEGATSAYRAVPDNAVKRVLEGGVKNFMKSPAPQALAEGYGQLFDAFPMTMRHIESAADIASVLPVSKAMRLAGSPVGAAASPIVKPIAQNAKDAALGIAARGSDELAQTTANIEGRSAAAYGRMRDAGVDFTPDTSAEVVKKIGKAIESDGPLNPSLHKNTISVFKQFRNEATQGEMGLDRLDQWRRVFGGIVNDGFREGRHSPDAQKAMSALSAIDDSVDMLSSRNFKGVDIEASPKLQTAIDEWGSLKELQRHLENTIEGTAQFAGKQGGFWRRQTISRAAEDAKNLANVKKQISNQERIITQLEDSVASSPQASAKAKEAISSLREARREWSRARKFDTVSEIVRKSDGDVDYMKRELRKLADNPKKTRGFNDEERQLLLNASRYGNTEGILKMLGKFGVSTNMRLGQGALPAIAATVPAIAGGGGSGVAAIAGGTAAKYGQKIIGRGKTERLLQEIERQK